MAQNLGKLDDRRRVKYFSSFALRHLTQMRILRKGGVLGRGNADWRNVSEHCLIEAVGADVLAEALSAKRKILVEAALLHDWYKRREVEAMKAGGAEVGHKTTLTEDVLILREVGVSEDRKSVV